MEVTVMNLYRKTIEQIPNVRITKEIPHFIYPGLEATGVADHLFSTRFGGVSTDHLGTMNLSYARGDKKENVDENYRRIASLLECELEDFVFSHQTHTTNVRVVTEDDKGKGIVYPLDYQDVDGLVTNVPGIVLSTFYADCVPLFFIDPVEKVIGLSHSGWRGTVGRMGEKTIQCMKENFSCNPQNIKAAIGPSICQSCYEVSEDVADAFKKEFQGHEAEILIAKGQGKYLLDLWKANEIVLLEAGILPENLEITNVCTCCNSEALFSHRASNGKRGNLAAFLKLKKS